jgi:hypothetical protein
MGRVRPYRDLRVGNPLVAGWGRSVDDNLDDNGDDYYSLNYGNYSPKSLQSCLVTVPVRS